MTEPRPVAFLDRDGTIIHDDHYIADPARVRLLDGAAAAIARLRAAGAAVVVVTNQSGIARGRISEAQYAQVRDRLDALLAAAGTRVDATYHCPHHPEIGGACACRKPGPLLYRQAIDDLGLDARRTAFVGDRWSDAAAASTFGGLGLLVPAPETTAADIARARETGQLADTLDAAVTRILEAFRPIGAA